MHHKLIPLDAAIVSAASVVGGKERQGPLGDCFDFYSDNDRFGKDTWEKAESEMQRMALSAAMGKAGWSEKDVGVLFAGDLLNQCTGSAYGLLSYDIPFLGLYGACSTMVEGLLLASTMVSNRIYDTAAAVTSSHNASAERQFRTPLEYGAQRPPTGQWTVTGSGAVLVTHRETATAPLAHVTAAMPGITVDKQIKDANDMGAAMAPAAESTLLRYFATSGDSPSDYDLIVTGDLGWEGGDILCELMLREGIDIRPQYNDCGRMMFSRNTQDTHSGGSGCGCVATVFASYLLPRIANGQIKRMLLMGTGALLSPDSLKQGQSIPGVAHLICVESPTVNRKENP